MDKEAIKSLESKKEGVFGDRLLKMGFFICGALALGCLSGAIRPSNERAIVVINREIWKKFARVRTSKLIIKKGKVYLGKKKVSEMEFLGRREDKNEVYIITEDVKNLKSRNYYKAVSERTGKELTVGFI